MRSWAHLQLVALVFVGQEVSAGEGKVVGKAVAGVAIDLVPVCRNVRIDLKASTLNGIVPVFMSCTNSLHAFSNFSTGSTLATA